MANVNAAIRPWLAIGQQWQQLAQSQQEDERIRMAMAERERHNKAIEELKKKAEDLERKQAVYSAALSGPQELKALAPLLGIDTKQPYYQSLMEMAKSKREDNAAILGYATGIGNPDLTLEQLSKNPELAFRAVKMGLEMEAQKADIGSKQARAALDRQKAAMLGGFGETGISGGSGDDVLPGDLFSAQRAARMAAAGMGPAASIGAAGGIELQKERGKLEAQMRLPLKPRERRILGLSGQQATRKDLPEGVIVPDEDEIKGLEGSMAAVRELDMLTKRATGLLERSGGRILSIAGALNSAANSIRAQSVALLESTGGSLDIDRSKHSDAISSMVDNLLPGAQGSSADKKKLGSTILDLAIARMATKGQEGRSLSDKELAAELTALGQSPDPKVFIQALQDANERSWNRVALRHSATTGLPARESMKIISGEQREISQPSDTFGGTPSQYPEGTVVRDSNTGTRYITRSGEWVPL